MLASSCTLIDSCDVPIDFVIPKISICKKVKILECFVPFELHNPEAFSGLRISFQIMYYTMYFFKKGIMDYII